MNRRIAVSSILAVLAAVLLTAAAPVKPAVYDVRVVAATYPGSPVPTTYCGAVVAGSREPIRIMISTTNTTTGLPPANPWNYSVNFLDTVASIPDANFSQGFDRNCLCEMPAQRLDGEAAGTQFVLSNLDLRYTGNGTCYGYGGMDVAHCTVPNGDYRFAVSAQNQTSGTGGATVGILQVRAGNCAPANDQDVTF